MTDGERWLPIPGYEGRYEASSLGRIRSLDIIDGRGVKHLGRNLAIQACHNNGYLTIRLKKGDGGKTFLVHRLVARAFLGEPDPGNLDVCHADGNKHNNVIENLRFDTRSANLIEHAMSGRYRNQNTQKTHCINGHDFTEENTYRWVSANGRKRTRGCRTCRRETVAVYRSRTV